MLRRPIGRGDVRLMSEFEANEIELERKALENLVVDNPDLEWLEALLDRFNIFEAIGVVRQELRHSDLLAFLLDPRENHGLGDGFAKRLLQLVLTTAEDISVTVTPNELELWNLNRMEVRREWQHVDILLLDEQHKLAVVIENKIDSGEHSDQLSRYHRVVSQHYPGWLIIGLYLTPVGEMPSNKAYLSVDYGLVCDVIDGLAESKASIVNPDVKTLMTHYTDMLRRHIVSDSDVAGLCRQIYHKHKRALDLIYEHRPDPQGANRTILTNLVKNTKGLVLTGTSKWYVWFHPQEWEVPALRANDNRNGFLRFVFHNNPNRLDLLLETSPGHQGTRRRLFEMGQKDEKLFNALVDPGTNDYPKLYRRIFLTPEQYDEASNGEREREIRRQWAAFLEEDLPRIERAVKGETWIWEGVDDHSP